MSVREKEWRQTEHGVIPRVDLRAAEAYAAERGILVRDAWVELVLSAWLGRL